eukprot:TRINITY_DN19969_c0_g2_i1.p1 TRINITY_DN19969_c0_g2~~TRINITY_DN19969_c0_g2_i1.p1  ORF type:complete len:389 (-),score=103.37 TRINITY_DN19969_c0_g2_i1:100-1266(-)
MGNSCCNSGGSPQDLLKGELDRGAVTETIPDGAKRGYELGGNVYTNVDEGAWVPGLDATLPVSKLVDFGLSPFDFSAEEQCRLYLQMMQVLGLQDKFSIPSAVISGFAGKALRKYRDVPYHNAYHGFSITQFLFTAYNKSAITASLMTSCPLLAMFVAVLVHDIDHPGNNNAWEVAVKSPLAVKYEDKAVLENHHAALGLQLLEDPSCNMFANVDSKAKEGILEVYRYAILQTDMAQHFKMVEELKARKEKGKEGAFSTSSTEEVKHLVGVLVHSADISNPLLPKFDLCKSWAERITKEFVNQYDNEVKAGLPPTKMWENLRDTHAFYKSQVGFIDFLVAPLWNTVVDMIPDLQEEGKLRDNLTANKAQWQQLAIEEEKKKEKATTQV